MASQWYRGRCHACSYYVLDSFLEMCTHEIEVEAASYVRIPDVRRVILPTTALRKHAVLTAAPSIVTRRFFLPCPAMNSKPKDDALLHLDPPPWPLPSISPENTTSTLSETPPLSVSPETFPRTLMRTFFYSHVATRGTCYTQCSARSRAVVRSISSSICVLS